MQPHHKMLFWERAIIALTYVSRRVLSTHGGMANLETPSGSKDRAAWSHCSYGPTLFPYPAEMGVR